MLDANLYTLKFVKSTHDPERLFLIEEATGDPVYFRLKVPQGDETRIELYHASSQAPLGSFEHVSSKLKLVSLANPSAVIEMKNTGYISWEWMFHYENDLKFCWRKDIVGLGSNKRGYTCWMIRKPDPDYPCAIYRPGSSTSSPSCQFLDFNIRRIEHMQDGRGFELVIVLSLLGFTEALADWESRRSPPGSSPISSRASSHSQLRLAPVPTPKPASMDYSYSAVEANELRIAEGGSTTGLANQGLKMFEDPLFLYLYVHAPTPQTHQRAVAVAAEIKRERAKKAGEELHQYLVDEIISRKMMGDKQVTDAAASSTGFLKIYLSRTPLEEFLPKSATKSDAPSTRSSQSQVSRRTAPTPPPKEAGPSAATPPNSLSHRLWTGIHRPLSRVISIQSSFSTSSESGRTVMFDTIDEEKETIDILDSSSDDAEGKDEVVVDPEKQAMNLNELKRKELDRLEWQRKEEERKEAERKEHELTLLAIREVEKRGNRKTRMEKELEKEAQRKENNEKRKKKDVTRKEKEVIRKVREQKKKERDDRRKEREAIKKKQRELLQKEANAIKKKEKEEKKKARKEIRKREREEKHKEKEEKKDKDELRAENVRKEQSDQDEHNDNNVNNENGETGETKNCENQKWSGDRRSSRRLSRVSFMSHLARFNFNL